MKHWMILTIVWLVFAWPEIGRSQDIRYAIAQAYGYDSFGVVEEIGYTFHVQNQEKTLARSWKWFPKSDRVVFQPGSEAEVAYSRKELEPEKEDLIRIDQWFINDQYWLLFPFHLLWDRGIAVKTYPKPARRPSGRGWATRVTVSYPEEGGYTPGDVYDLYVGVGNRIDEWVYFRAGSSESTRRTFWERHTPVGPLTLSLNRPADEGNFRVWFTDVAVRYRRNDTLVEAHAEREPSAPAR